MDGLWQIYMMEAGEENHSYLSDRLKRFLWFDPGSKRYRIEADQYL